MHMPCVHHGSLKVTSAGPRRIPSSGNSTPSCTDIDTEVAEPAGDSDRKEASPRVRANAMKRILIVEDNEMNRDVLSRRLTRRGYDVLVAAGRTQKGSSVLRPSAPDLILMDLGLPEIDGWECVRRLQADRRDRRDSDHRADRARDGRRSGARARTPAATTSTPSRSISPACSTKMRTLLDSRSRRRVEHR